MSYDYQDAGLGRDEQAVRSSVAARAFKRRRAKQRRALGLSRRMRSSVQVHPMRLQERREHARDYLATMQTLGLGQYSRLELDEDGLGLSLKRPKWLRKMQPGKVLKKIAAPLALVGGALLIPGAGAMLVKGAAGAVRGAAGAARFAGKGLLKGGKSAGRLFGGTSLPSKTGKGIFGTLFDASRTALTPAVQAEAAGADEAYGVVNQPDDSGIRVTSQLRQPVASRLASAADESADVENVDTETVPAPPDPQVALRTAVNAAPVVFVVVGGLALLALASSVRRR
jgi:hypothetical protein